MIFSKTTTLLEKCNKKTMSKQKTQKQGNKNPQRTSFLVTNLEHRISKANSALYSYAAPFEPLVSAFEYY